ncbi:Mor transcription activator family protein [Tahibacter soli]|uniref:Mor transcription activator family protein n=1 Tax=Tahibacter soli TaxID=2983605 RepID=A0A9X4BK76_9GAMM|nr:Mor transcription activator family protein [Tahibacter soli]MDC8012914.1 Mor transcription activator family protein [Tahibacter soli]
MSGQGEMFDALTCDPLDLIERGGEVIADKSRWPQRLVDLYDVLFAYARKTGADAETAARDASARAVLIADYLGGAVVYLPRGDAMRKAVRDSEAYRRHDGRNTNVLAREYGMTTTKFYELLARERKRRLRKMQGRLFQ